MTDRTSEMLLEGVEVSVGVEQRVAVIAFRGVRPRARGHQPDGDKAVDYGKLPLLTVRSRF